MPIMNSALVDSDRGIFSVLGIATVQLPGLLWNGEDIDNQTARGAAFHGFLSDKLDARSVECASACVVDVSGDEDEPDVSSLFQSSVATVDADLKADIESNLLKSKRRLIKWMGSHLNGIGESSNLITAYIAEDAGCEFQYIAMRTTFQGRKIVILVSFDIQHKDVLAAPMFNVIRTARFQGK